MLVRTKHADRWISHRGAGRVVDGRSRLFFGVGLFTREGEFPADLALFAAVLILVAAFFVTIFWLFTPRGPLTLSGA